MKIFYFSSSIVCYLIYCTASPEDKRVFSRFTFMIVVVVSFLNSNSDHTRPYTTAERKRDEKRDVSRTRTKRLKLRKTMPICRNIVRCGWWNNKSLVGK